MNKYQIKNEGQALAYITDCNLATVCHIAMKKNRVKYEFRRQISIAQTAVDWMIQFGIDVEGTMAQDVIECGSVENWAKKFMPENK